MILYHFVNACHGLENIKNRRLKVARIMELNDPFEFLSVDLSDPYFRKALNELKKQNSENYGILCFSTTWRNPLLWAHYADKHKGVCLEFEVPDEGSAKIEYVKNRLKCPKRLDELTQEFMKKLLLTKFVHWAYEEEYRLWVSLKSPEKDTAGLFYVPFSETDLRLTSVIVGAESCITPSKVCEALGDLNGHVKKIKARADFQSFDVVRDREDPAWKQFAYP